MDTPPCYTAFIDQRRVVSGTLLTVALGAKAAVSDGAQGPVAVFDDSTGQEVDIDLRGTAEDVAAWVTRVTDLRGRGRPHLGVVAREVTLLPRHWEWLKAQPGGASGALRRLVDAARHANRAVDDARQQYEAAYRFMAQMAGDLPGFEEASRALFAGSLGRFRELVAAWPADVRDHAVSLACGDASGDTVAAVTAPASQASVVSVVSAASQPQSPLDELVTAEHRAAVHRALHSAFGPAAVEALERLPGGSGGPAAVYRLTVASTDYVLRIEGPPGALRDPARQYDCHRIAAAAGVAPALVYAHAGDGISIAEFVRTTPAATPLPGDSPVKAIVAAVKLLHAAPRFPPVMHYLDCIGLLMDQVSAAAVLPASIQRYHRESFDELLSAYPRPDSDIVSSHNDLNPSNVLFTGGRPWFVDWESAFATDRFVDLAAVTNFFGETSDDDEVALRTYFGAAFDYHHRARLLLMQHANRLFYSMVLLSAVAAAQPGIRITEDQLRDARTQWPSFQAIRGEMTALATHAGRLRFACVLLNDAQRDIEDRHFAEALVFAPLIQTH